MKPVIYLVLVFFFAVSGYQSAPASPDPAIYLQLLHQFSSQSPGYGADELTSEPAHHPMAYGSVLSAEAIRYQTSPTDEGKVYTQNAARWLLDSADLDGDGLPGWGLPNAWDAFNDGTVNPANQVYLITSAIVLNGFLDALQVPELWTADEQRDMLTITHDVSLRFCRDAWEETEINGEAAGYFWYSTNPNDSFFVTNVSSMNVGVISRYLYEYQTAIPASDRDLLQNCVDKAARGVALAAEMVDDRPVWLYTFPLPDKQPLQITPNDLAHHAYTLIGMEMYRDFGGGRVPLPWSREQAAASIDLFNSDVGLRDFPSYNQRADRPSILWGLGKTLAFQALYADDEAALATINNIAGNYGDWDSLQLYPKYDSTDATFYPRHAAFVLWGLSLYFFH